MDSLFKPVGKIGNKTWQTKHGKMLLVAKGTVSTKKVIYFVPYSSHVSVKLYKFRYQKSKEKSGTCWYRWDVTLNYKPCPVTGFRHVRLLHDYVPSHTSNLVKQFLNQRMLQSCITQHTLHIKPYVTFYTYLIVVTNPKSIYSVNSQCLRGLP